MAVPSCTTRVCKPGSVIDSHLSKPKIALGFQPPPRNGRADLMFLHGVAPDRVYIIFRVLLEMLFPETTDLLPHIFSLEILKYTKYICNLQSLICVNISRWSKKSFLRSTLGVSYTKPLTYVSISWVRSYRTFSPLPICSGEHTGGISLLHLSWGHPRRALPVILALWSPDFPHPDPVGDPAATVRPGRGNIVLQETQLVKPLMISVWENVNLFQKKT